MIRATLDGMTFEMDTTAEAVELALAFRGKDQGRSRPARDPSQAPRKPRAVSALAPKTIPPEKPVVAGPATSTPTPHADSVRGKILAALTSAGRPMRSSELVAATKFPANRLKAALNQLRDEKRVTLTGYTSQARYALAASQPGATKPESGPQFETVWNGTKDAKGEASLIGDRPRKAV